MLGVFLQLVPDPMKLRCCDVSRAGEMAQRLRALTTLPRGPEFKSQQPHGGSQPSVMRSDALFWCV
ncbi:rCG23351 [Rattus norvegicus]|uniref:RCG23351 n=1 Tax=Rattus norvegicus TaxID=10116 RepID=A6KGZ5_RAT|nr:rCG23351 [Rattus norvegicus]